MAVTRVKVPQLDADGNPRFVAFDYDDVTDTYTEVVIIEGGGGGGGLTGILDPGNLADIDVAGAVDLTGETPKRFVYLHSDVDEPYDVDLPDAGGAAVTVLIAHTGGAENVTLSVDGVPVAEQPGDLSPLPDGDVVVDLYGEFAGVIATQYRRPISSGGVAVDASAHPTLNPLTDTQEAFNTAAESYAVATDGRLDAIEARPFVSAYKTTGTGRTNDTASADPDLSFTLGVGTWAVTALAINDGDTTADIKAGLAHSGTATIAGGSIGPAQSASGFPVTVQNGGPAGTVTGYGCGGTGVDTVVTITATVTVTVTGTLSVQWAQRVTNATATNVKPGSHLIAHRIA